MIDATIIEIKKSKKIEFYEKIREVTRVKLSPDDRSWQIQEWLFLNDFRNSLSHHHKEAQSEKEAIFWGRKFTLKKDESFIDYPDQYVALTFRLLARFLDINKNCFTVERLLYITTNFLEFNPIEGIDNV